MFRKINEYELTQQLKIAMYNGKIELISKLIKQGANTAQRDSFSTHTVLMSAIIDFNGKTDIKYKIIEELLKNGADPNAGLDARNLYICRIPLDAGATPLMLLLVRDPDFSKETRDIAELLLAHKADINRATESVKNTILHYANALDKSTWIDYLEKHGADKNAKNHAGLIPSEIRGKSVSIPWLRNARL